MNLKKKKKNGEKSHNDKIKTLKTYHHKVNKMYTKKMYETGIAKK